MVTLKDVGELAGVTATTASAALRGKDYVKPETTQRGRRHARVCINVRRKKEVSTDPLDRIYMVSNSQVLFRDGLSEMNNPASVSMLSGLRKPQIRF